MISIQPYNNSNLTVKLKNILSMDSMIIIGRGNNEYNLNKVIKPKSNLHMTELYGKCELTNAYETAYILGARNIYVMNAYKTTDFIDCIKIIKQLNFSYIVPIGIKISDSFYSSEYKKNIYFAEYYLNEIKFNSNSTIIFTDSHAELYENISDFVNDMHKKVMNFKLQSQYILDINGNNLLFCTNNIASTTYSNIVLAASLVTTIPGNYPKKIMNKAIFDVDSNDIGQKEIIYFKSNYLTNTSIENLNNFRTLYDANKIVPINMVIKNIERTLDFSFVVGQFYNELIKVHITDYLNNVMKKMIKTNIRNFIIRNIEFIPNHQTKTGYILVQIDIYPKNSIDKVITMLEVK